MNIIALDHPVIKHKLTILRDKKTDFSTFRRTCYEMMKFMIPYATDSIKTMTTKIETPLEKMDSEVMLSSVIVIPILRAGLGMSEPFIDLLPEIKVGHIGVQRNPKTFEAEPYYFKIPTYHDDDLVIVVDPMLATGTSLIHALTLLKEHGIEDVMVMTIISAKEGIDNLIEKFPNITLITASIDRELNENKYILPGLGDAGNRLFGTEH